MTLWGLYQVLFIHHAFVLGGPSFRHSTQHASMLCDHTVEVYHFLRSSPNVCLTNLKKAGLEKSPTEDLCIQCFLLYFSRDPTKPLFSVLKYGILGFQL